jgi:hypothetical protein
VAFLVAPTVRGVVEPEAVLALADLRFRGIWNCRGRGFEEAEGADLLGERYDPAGKGWVVSVRVFRGGDLDRGSAGLNLYLVAYLVFRDRDTVTFEVSESSRDHVDHIL